MKETALYIHIPFCDHKCIYCDFYSIITSDNIQPYLIALKKEMTFYSKYYDNERIFTTVYFGGGTPSLMKPDYLGKIILQLKKNFNISENAEITMETNPGTVDKEKLKNFYDIGINRISIGIQSFQEDELNFLTRIHNKDVAIKTVYDAHDAGFDNINIDLIFNLPKQTKEKWLSNLETAVLLPVNHISAYSLILERGTILNKIVLDGKLVMQDDDNDAELYELTIDFLISHGYIQYEVSNFAKEGFECMHNNAYWRYKDYLGLGTSSHSFVDGKRWWNYSSLKRYISSIEKKGNAEANHEFINAQQKLDEYVMLALRSKGLDINEFKNLFNDNWIDEKYNYFKQLTEENLAFFNESSICLTKKGYAVCDEILSKLLA